MSDSFESEWARCSDTTSKRDFYHYHYARSKQTTPASEERFFYTTKVYGAEKPPPYRKRIDAQTIAKPVRKIADPMRSTLGKRKSAGSNPMVPPLGTSLLIQMMKSTKDIRSAARPPKNDFT
jgi:hypothetical protein